MVVPPLPTLLSHSTTQHLSNFGPFSDPISPHQLHQQSASRDFDMYNNKEKKKKKPSIQKNIEGEKNKQTKHKK